MQFGINVSTDDPGGRDPMSRLEDYMERGRTAADMGFDTVAVSHRYSFGPAKADARGEPLRTSRFQPLLMLAHLAAELRDRVNYVTSIYMSTFAHPVQLAEDIATLDVFCRGRLRLGVGLGWMPYELEAFGIPRRERVTRFEEGIEFYRRLLTEDVVDFEGKHFQARDARMIARAIQKPMPPLWIGASADPAVLRAARMGDSWIMSAHIAIDELERQVVLYRDELNRLNKPFPDERPIVRIIYVAPDRETALKEAEPAIAKWYRERGTWGWFLTQGSAGAIADDVMRSGRWIIGDPDDCVEQISQFRDRLGVNHMVFAMPRSDGGQDKQRRSMRLLAERVLPHLRPKPTAKPA